MKTIFTVRGKCSTFGGPNDSGVGKREGLALVDPSEVLTGLWWGLFYPVLNDDLGLARNLNPHAHFCAMRWDYNETPRTMLRNAIVKVSSRGLAVAWCRPVDWGPAEHTGRVIDLSWGALCALSVGTDDIVTAELIV